MRTGIRKYWKQDHSIIQTLVQLFLSRCRKILQSEVLQIFGLYRRFSWMSSTRHEPLLTSHLCKIIQFWTPSSPSPCDGWEYMHHIITVDHCYHCCHSYRMVMYLQKLHMNLTKVVSVLIPPYSIQVKWLFQSHEWKLVSIADIFSQPYLCIMTSFLFFSPPLVKEPFWSIKNSSNKYEHLKDHTQFSWST